MENEKEEPRVGGEWITLNVCLNLEDNYTFDIIDENDVREARELSEYYGFLFPESPPTESFPEIIWHCIFGKF
jgi:hypothetical protein